MQGMALILFTGRCGCLLWFELRFCWCKFQFLVEQLVTELASVAVAVAVAVNRMALIWKLARLDILNIRVDFNTHSDPPCQAW